jgi:hypothetical protein
MLVTIGSNLNNGAECCDSEVGRKINHCYFMLLLVVL